MNSPPSSSGRTAFLERNGLRLLILLNILIGIYYLPIAVQIGYATISSAGNVIGPDFIVYYAAARILHTAPNALYDLPTYQDLYALLRPTLTIPKTHILFPYLSPPALALFLYPLAALPLDISYIAFGIINVALLLILAWQIRLCVRHTPVQKNVVFLQSLLLCLFPIFNIFCQGQISLIVCVLSMAFILDMRGEKPWRCGLWLALALHIKPQYFIPLLFVLAGGRQWKHLITTLVYAGALAALSTLICGVDIWQHYLRALFVTSAYAHIPLPMVNFRGLLELCFGTQSGFSWITNITYLGVCIYAALVAYLRLNRATLVPAIMAMSLFFSPYMLSHDMILLLPVALSILIACHDRIPKLALVLIYLITVWGPDITFAQGGDLIPFYLLNCVISAGIVLTSLYALYSRQGRAILAESAL